MKYDLELLKADILDELTKIEELVRDFRSVESKLGLPQEDVPFYDRAARGFRHKFRHSYSFELDWEKERLLAERFPDAAALLRKRLDSFLMELEQIDEYLET